MRLYDYSASGNCLKVRMLMSLIGCAYERVPVDIFAGDTLTDDYARLNPSRETPVLEFGDGTVLVQSSAILWFLGEGGPSLPSSPLERAQVVQWLCFEQEYVMPGIGGARFRIQTGRDPDKIPARLALGRAALDRLEEHLNGRLYLVGDGGSIADVSSFAYVHLADQAGFELASFPAVCAWLERIRSWPGFVNDLTAYPKNACQGQSRSIYDQ